MKRKLIVAGCAGLFLLSASLVAAAKPAALKSLTICTEASPDGFDVVQYNALVTTNASADLIFNGLVAFDEATSKVVPALAEKWDVSADGLSYTFYLRQNVHFHTRGIFKPSRAFNADDVAFTFDRMLNPANPWHKVAGPSGFPHAQSLQLPERVQAIQKLGPNTIRFTLKKPDATFLSVLTMGFASIYSAEYADQLLKANRFSDFNLEPVGTGPFKLRNYQRDALIRYDRNPQYWGARPQIDQLIYAITPDPAVRAQRLNAGECQVSLSPRPQDVSAARADQVLKIVEAPGFMTAFVALNTQHKPLDNKKVRQAINLAFDRSNYLNTLFNGTALPASNPYPPGTWSYAQNLQPWPHNIARAKQLLAEAGYPKGFETVIWTRPTGSTLNPNPQTGAELLQADLEKIGIKAQVRIVEWGELIREAKQGAHDLLFMGWAGDNGDPDNFLTPQFSCAAVRSGTNFARFCQPELDNLIAQAKVTTDQARRTQLYLAAQKIIYDEALWIPIGHPKVTALTRGNIVGYRVSPFGRQNFTAVSVN
ncbi:ABC transporter substrate-binding protein [Mycoavidus sp. B2-EB]|uniref:ABC transporter substrate-binding protein n=1 Tax=Mycoavidus sp. B2-EB TaxID=2651972 RepID=UPI00162339EB|nr:ABC transporter substrate-binding protein [Mycoavidus sp. B2-EB]BBO60450.1 ABC transporter substrate-binding protein [Mycoavidus sp. B2-EB]